jgi:hypothetical protein
MDFIFIDLNGHKNRLPVKWRPWLLLDPGNWRTCCNRNSPVVDFSDQRIVFSIRTSQNGSIVHCILPNWWQYRKYILFRNHSIRTSGHFSWRTFFRQRFKQNLFFRISTWQMMYIRFARREPASWLRSFVQWTCCHLSKIYTHKGFVFGGSSPSPGFWHPQSSCCLHYSFFTDVKEW